MKRSTAAIQDARQPDWFYLDDRLIDAHGPTIGAIGVAVYAALARHAKANGVAEVAYDTIAEHLDISRNTVKAKLRALESAGLISIAQQTDERGNPIGANIYTLCVIPEQKQERRKRGVPIIAPLGSNADPPHATVDQGVPIIDPPESNAAYMGHDSISNESDPPPPTSAPPAGGGGGFDPQVARLFASYGIKQAEPLARLYGDAFPDVTLEQLRDLCARLDDPTAGGYRGSRLYRALKNGPPDTPPKPSPAPLPPAYRAAPPAAPAEALGPEQLAALRAQRLREAPHGTTAPDPPPAARAGVSPAERR